MILLRNLALWMHVCCMVGTLGILLTTQFGLPPAVRDERETTGKVFGLANTLIGIGLITGFFVYYLTMRVAPVSPRFHQVVGIKFLILLGAGMCLGIGSARVRKGRADTAHQLRWLALLLLAAAAGLAISL